MQIKNDAEKLEDGVVFSEAEIAIVKDALKTKLYVKTEAMDIRLPKWQAMLTKLSELFGIPEIKLVIEGEECPGRDNSGAFYLPETNTIKSLRLSLVSILHAFGAALAFQKQDAYPDGLDAMSFGLSAFKQAAPRMFETAKAAGRLAGTDVPYTDGGKIVPVTYSDDDDPDRSDDDGGSSDAPDIDPENLHGKDGAKED